MTSPLPPHAFRPPKQERSRAAWARALDAGLEILEERGLDGVSINEVCERARISAPSIYARVDGLAGLIAAIYEHGMDAVRTTEAELVGGLSMSDAPTEVRIAAAVDLWAELFSRHQATLRSVITSSVLDERIHVRGVEEALRAQQALHGILRLGAETNRDIAAMIFAEVVVRTVYGSDFVSSTPETDRQFRDRVTRMAVARAGSQSD